MCAHLPNKIIAWHGYCRKVARLSGHQKARRCVRSLLSWKYPRPAALQCFLENRICFSGWQPSVSSCLRRRNSCRLTHEREHRAESLPAERIKQQIPGERRTISTLVELGFFRMFARLEFPAQQQRHTTKRIFH